MGGAGLPSLAVIILTFNEELHLARALESVRTIASDIIVIDSFSTDRTVEIATAAGARVFQNPFVTQAQQFAWGVEQAAITADWTLRLDADEVIEEDLAHTIETGLGTLPPDVTGVTFARKHIFLGRWIRHGGRYPLVMLRLWRTGLGRVEDRWMDEHIVVSRGSTVHFDGGFSDINLHNLGFFTDKHNKYATREMIDVIGRRYGLLQQDDGMSAKAASRQASVKRRIKEKFYARLPLGVGPFGYFLYRYIVQLGFLDGGPGLIYHGLQGFWYRFLVDAKVYEAKRALAGHSSDEKRLAALSALSGYDLIGQLHR